MAKRLLSVASLMTALLFIACAGPSGPTQEEIAAEKVRVVADAALARVTAADEGRVVIGLAGPMSGDLQKYGTQMWRGAQLAVADLNANGGILGRRVVLEVADDHCGRQDAQAAAKALIEKGVVFVDGHFCSGSSIEGSAVYGTDVLQITPSVTNGLVTDIAAQRKITTMLRVVGRDEMQGDFAADWLAKAYAGQRIVVLSDNSAYGKGIARHLLARLKQLGVSPALVAEFAQGQTNYVTLLEKLKDLDARAIYIAAYHDDIGRLTWALRVAKFDAEIIGPDILNNLEFWSFSQQRGNGVRFSDLAPAAERPEATEIWARLRAEYPGELGDYALNSYAAVQVFAAAAEATKSVDAKVIADYLRQNSVKTILGELAWDDKGDLKHVSYIWYIWQNGLTVRP